MAYRSEPAVQCPRTGLKCPHPDHHACVYTRDSRQEFDDAQPGDKLLLQHVALICGSGLALRKGQGSAT